MAGSKDHPEGFWAPYRPTSRSPWDVRRVVHLHRRAGFAATVDEVRRDLDDGPEASVERFLSGRTDDAAFEHTSAAIAGAAVDSGDPDRLKAWWLLCMLVGPDPLGERLTLMWHNHFATSNRKVDDLAAMYRQNELFRRFARSPFGDLLNAAIRDPALLVWLDAPANRRGHPNENLARELMELFTLGIGHYSENDVKDAARALTGWTLLDGRFVENPAAHDSGEKTILGKTGRWNGSEFLRLLLDHPSTSHRLAARLCETFMGEGCVSAEGVDELAEDLRTHHLDIGRGVAIILRSGAFFDASNIGKRVVDPVAFVVGSVRALGCLDPMPSTLELARWTARIGQDLFYPPNVGGWPGGRAWLDVRGMIARANFAVALVSGLELGLDRPPDVLRLADQKTDINAIVRTMAEHLLGHDPGTSWRDRIAHAAGSKSLPDSARRAAALILSSPEGQLA